MKRIILFILVILFVCSSCRTHKDTIHIEQQSEWDRLSYIRDSIAEDKYRKQQEEWWEYVEQEIEEEKHVIYYDVTKPTDSITGKPPVVKEEIYTRKDNTKKNSGSEKDIVECESKKEVSNTDVIESGEEKSTTDSETIIESESGKRANSFLLFLVTISIAMIIKYIYKLFK